MPRFPGSGRRPCGLAFLLPTAALSLALASCHSGGHPVSNHPPHVEITGSPVEGDSVNYVVDFHWNAWDDDGAITRSEYAVDIPASFTPEQIADPATPGIEWTSLTESHVRIRIRVAPGDSVPPGGVTYNSERASSPHTFFVRSYDNEEARSAVAERSFNAWTALPRTTLSEPRVGVFGLPYVTTLGPLLLRWAVVDPDASSGSRPPRTEYKVIPVAVLGSTLDANALINVDPGPRHPWVPVPGDSALVAPDPGPGAYVVALRSIDEAGGVESRFEFGRNALQVQVGRCPPSSNPILTVSDPLLGGNVFPSDGDVVDLEVFAGQFLSWDLSADARDFGGTIQGYRWCVDSAEDPRSGGDAPGCVPWGSARRTPRIGFSTLGLHTVAFAARATSPACGAGSTGGTLRLTVLPRTFDRDVLYVDDYYDPPADAESDRRFLAALAGAGYTTIDSYDAWGAGDLDGVATPPSLALLSRYRLVFWSVRGVGGGTQEGSSALLRATSCASPRVLRQYVAAGGALWINGDTVFGALRQRNDRTGGNCLGTTTSTQDFGMSLTPGSFVADFLHIEGGDIRRATTGLGSNGLLRARPATAVLSEGFPTLEADSTMFPAALGGIGYYDAMFQPTYLVEGGLDTLYVASPARGNSPFNGKPIAWRYADPWPEPRQGPVVLTALPLQRVKEGAPARVVNGVTIPGTGLDGLVQVMAAWLRAHDVTRTLAPPWDHSRAAPPARYDGASGGARRLRGR